MALPWCRVMIVLIVAICDIAVYLYDMYVVANDNLHESIGYAAHISGAIAGLLVGILSLKNLRWENHERYIWMASASLFVILIGTAILWSVAFPSHFTGISPVLNISCVSDHII